MKSTTFQEQAKTVENEKDQEYEQRNKVRRPVVTHIVWTFRSEYEYEMEYEYDFRASSRCLQADKETLETRLVRQAVICTTQTRFEKSYSYSSTRSQIRRSLIVTNIVTRWNVFSIKS